MHEWLLLMELERKPNSLNKTRKDVDFITQLVKPKGVIKTVFIVVNNRLKS